MPFPGESPTVALAMAAGEKFGFHPKAKPARASARRNTTGKPRKAERAQTKTRRASAKTRAR